MALRNRKEQRALRLMGVNLADNDDEMEFGWFVELSNWVPGELYSIKKKRGIAEVSSGLTEFSLTDPC